MYPKLVLIDPNKGIDSLVPQQPLASEGRDEAWLRDFLLAHPEALPCETIDAAFSDPVPICRELRTTAGPIDALFATRRGGLVLVECKLWRNPQARREVVSQILDYAKEIARWRYENLQREVSRARQEPGVNALYQVVASRYPETQEALFVDQVSRNLAAGRFLLLVVGDGIREGTESIIQYVARHSGLHFTFGLVETVGYSLPNGQFLVQPRLLAKTTNIERTVVRIESISPGLQVHLDDPDESDFEVSENQESLGDTKGRSFDPAMLAADKAFSSKFIEKLRLDDPSKSSTRRSYGRVQLNLGVPHAWIAALSARKKNRIEAVAVFKGGAGKLLFDKLKAERDIIDTELVASIPGVVPQWQSRGEFSWVAVQLVRSGQWKQQLEDDNLAWLLHATNLMVNVIGSRVDLYEGAI